MRNQQKKELAKLLFVRENLTQKEIAIKVQVTEKTISSWVHKGEWNQLKASITITKDETLRMLYTQINEISKNIATREEGQKFATSKETDTIVKLSAAIKNMETDTSVREVIEVFTKFVNWVRPVDLDKAKEITELCDNYIKSIMNTMK